VAEALGKQVEVFCQVILEDRRWWYVLHATYSYGKRRCNVRCDEIEKAQHS